MTELMDGLSVVEEDDAAALRADDVCFKCGKVLTVGLWPWCPHEDASTPAKHGTWFFK